MPRLVFVIIVSSSSFRHHAYGLRLRVTSVQADRGKEGSTELDGVKIGTRRKANFCRGFLGRLVLLDRDLYVLSELRRVTTT